MFNSYICWLVGQYTHPSEKYESIGMMKFPTEWENKCSKPPTRENASQNHIRIERIIDVHPPRKHQIIARFFSVYGQHILKNDDGHSDPFSLTDIESFLVNLPTMVFQIHNHQGHNAINFVVLTITIRSFFFNNHYIRKKGVTNIVFAKGNNSKPND